MFEGRGGCPCYWVLLWHVLIYHPIQPACLHFDASFSFFLCGTNPHKMSLACHVQQSKSTKLLPHGLEKSIKSTTASMSIMPTKKMEGIAMNNYFNEWIQAKLNIYKSPLESQVVFLFVLVTNIPFLVYTVSVLAFLFFRGYSQVCCHLMNAIWRLKENTKCH